MGNLFLYVLAAIGAGTIAIATNAAVKFISLHFLPPSQPLQKYKRTGNQPTYALITGASAGIGFGIAKELVKNGFGVILLGHLPDELNAAKATLEAATPGARVRIIVMNAITATPTEIESMVDSLKDINVSILVNNVGGSPVARPPFRQLGTYSAADVDAVINQNARFMARLTAAMLPLLYKASHRSLILNMSSQGMAGVPYIVIPELEDTPDTNHVDCLAIIPGDVLSQGNSKGVTEAAPKADHFGKRIVYCVDAALKQKLRAVCPYWRHDLEWRLMSWVPEDVLRSEVVKVIGMKRDAWNAYYEKTE
ncbi:3-ketoacyl-CoA reductase [Pochonia chlamydosporia 170]|uniref:3-ketoacyl-CoA reductase n=1 Tax=Pochonia chlamydosporia 170 TaxID=1380566 RepID=A0A179FAM7_METCM|nr:3-ketoacyl-CoA reductase [Pochonia chlamydosporia 170]OAQ62360.1 3-ketoacyl-CoA reductase [Pochonia chlamydosporia 170]